MFHLLTRLRDFNASLSTKKQSVTMWKAQGKEQKSIKLS